MVKKSIYLMAGFSKKHRNSTDLLFQAMLKETNHLHPSVAYIGAASSDNLEFFTAIKKELQRNGAGQVDLVPLASEGKHQAAGKLLKTAHLLFFSGGDVELGMKILKKRGVINLIKERFERGGVIGGISAGSIILSQQWLRWRNQDDDSTAELFDCIGVAPLICDVHDEDGEWQELKLLLRLRHIEGEIGYGIPSVGGLRIHPTNRIDALGHTLNRLSFHNGRVCSLH